jgi:hypothetical protein
MSESVKIGATRVNPIVEQINHVDAAGIRELAKIRIQEMVVADNKEGAQSQSRPEGTNYQKVNLDFQM